MSAAPKFTHGPWRVGGPNGYRNQLGIDPTIGAVYGAGAELEANARLVAAAPDLYHALRNLLDACEREDRAALPHVIRAAYAAVARVEGAS
jgi:hypothetical protein